MQLPKVSLEYRSSRSEAYAFVDKSNGQKREGYTITHVLEALDGTVYSLRQSPPVGIAQADYCPITHYTNQIAPLKKGTVYSVELSAFELDKGVVRGKIASATSNDL